MIRRGNAPCPYFIFWWRRVCCWEEDREETGGRANNVFCLIRFRGRRRDRLAPATASPGSASAPARSPATRSPGRGSSPLEAPKGLLPPPQVNPESKLTSEAHPHDVSFAFARARGEQRGSCRSAAGGRGALDTCRHSLRLLLFP
jgi:hypothetical protein